MRSPTASPAIAPLMKVRGMAILMTFVIGLMFIAGGALLTFGDRLSARTLERLDQPWVVLAMGGANYLFGLALMILFVRHHRRVKARNQHDSRDG